MSDDHADKAHDPRGPEMLRANLLGLGLTLALILFLTSSLPPVLMAPAFAKLAMLAGLATAAVAALLREHPLAETLTRWDQAAVLLAVALLAGFFTDHAAVQVYLDSIAQAAA